jgi:hypothetical protein
MIDRLETSFMGDPFDPYREALVVETTTVWPDELGQVGPTDRERIEGQLHADPARAAQLQYVRLYTGFCRRITVTEADLERLKDTNPPTQSGGF